MNRHKRYSMAQVIAIALPNIVMLTLVGIFWSGAVRTGQGMALWVWVTGMVGIAFGVFLGLCAAAIQDAKPGQRLLLWAIYVVLAVLALPTWVIRPLVS